MKILVIDDEFEAREAIKNLLSDFKVEVICTSDAVSALLSLKDHKNIEVVVTDYRLPGLGGKEWVDLLKHYHPEINIIVISGYEIAVDNLEEVKGLKILKKPIEKYQLLEAIGL